MAAIRAQQDEQVVQAAAGTARYWTEKLQSAEAMLEQECGQVQLRHRELESNVELESAYL